MNEIEAMARSMPNKAAIIVGETGETISYELFEARSRQASACLASLGVRRGDAVSLCMPNSPEFLVVAWGALRAGMTLVPISTKLTASEIGFIVRDSGSRLLVSSPGIGAAYEGLASELAGSPLLNWADATAADRHTAPVRRDAALDDGPIGAEMLYSSGTTGRPKGIRHIRQGDQPGSLSSATLGMFARLGVDGHDILHSPAPLYHSAPFRWTIAMLRSGGTVILSRRFDPEQSLALIERYRVTVTQWVPTHFIRLLKLPPATREAHDLTSIRVAIHAAAPCPVPVKQAMIDWLGPVVHEYYGSTEQAGLTMIDTESWLGHPGSVGQCIAGKLHICGGDGQYLAAGEVGTIFVEGGLDFHYHGDPEKTAASRNELGWTTVGDVGYLDAEGWLYLTDRKDFMIISGGVNIYPQEIEDALVTHAEVVDAAVFGTPHDDLGEQVTAVIQPADPEIDRTALAKDLQEWLRERFSPIKLPKRIEFVDVLPRLPTGKLQKLKLRDRFR